jgi:uncharacterized protein (TIGR04255 family)
MYDHETFRNAPIVEAVLDFAVAFDSTPSLDEMAHYGDGLETEFPAHRKRRMFDTSFRIVDDEPLFDNIEKHFWAFSSSDEKYIAQIRTDGFAFSRLKPYTSWSDFSERARNAWGKYCAEFAPTSIQRVALRYINRIELPNPVSIQEYFNTRISLADGLPQELSYVSFSFSVPDEKTHVGDVTFIIDRRLSTNEKLSAVFQVESRRERAISANDVETLTTTLADLRDLKNRIFFCSITEQTKAMFR